MVTRTLLSVTLYVPFLPSRYLLFKYLNTGVVFRKYFSLEKDSKKEQFEKHWFNHIGVSVGQVLSVEGFRSIRAF